MNFDNMGQHSQNVTASESTYQSISMINADIENTHNREEPPQLKLV